jgi:lipopolysaccharide transport system permease protein
MSTLLEERVIGVRVSMAGYLREAWAERDLALMLVRHQFQLRYKQNVLGVLWLVLQPIGMALLYTLLFGMILRVPSDNVPYGAFVLGGMILWQFVSRGVSEGTVSLANQGAVLSKVYFPRILVPLAIILSIAVDFLVIVVAVIVLLAITGLPPHAAIVTAPLYMALALVGVTGLSLWLTATDVLYRDLRNALPLVLQAWLYASPVIYPTSLVPENWVWLYRLNPLVGLVEGFRHSLVPGSAPPDPWSVAWSVLVIAATFVFGLFYFRRVERVLIDRI